MTDLREAHDKGHMLSGSLQSGTLGGGGRPHSKSSFRALSSMDAIQRIIERWYPFVGGLVAAGIYLAVPRFRTYVFPEALPTLLSAVVTIGGVAVGFLATIKSILLTIDDKPIIHRVKNAGLYVPILDYLRAAFFWSFALTVVSAAALFTDYKGLTFWGRWYAAGTAVWLFVAVAAILSYYRASAIWYTILKNLDVKHP